MMGDVVTFRCDACQAVLSHDCEASDWARGWRFVTIEGRALSLCEKCSPPVGQRFAVTPKICRSLAVRGVRLRVCVNVWGIEPA
jgi:hypothetical protein